MPRKTTKQRDAFNHLEDKKEIRGCHDQNDITPMEATALFDLHNMNPLSIKTDWS